MNTKILSEAPMIEMPYNPYKFWLFVDRPSDDECWRWTGRTQTNPTGLEYGYFGRCYRAHRVAWVLANGRAIPNGMIVRHTCDNPICVNPHHLLLGTHRDNIHDMNSRKRGARSKKTECLRGHSLSGDNLYVTALGKRHCKACQSERNRAWHIENRRKIEN